MKGPLVDGFLSGRTVGLIIRELPGGAEMFAQGLGFGHLSCDRLTI